MIKQIPKRMAFGEGSLVEFEAPVSSDKKTRPIKLNPLYSGGVVRFGFGAIVVDLDGMRIPGRRRPIQLNHDPDQLIGQSTSVSTDNGQLSIEGKAIRAMPATKLVEAAIDGGFQYEASMGFMIEKIAFLDKDEMTSVNGRDVKGPLLIVRQSELIEGSIVPSGADREARTRFSAGDDGLIEVEIGGNDMPSKAKSDLDPITAFEADHPDAVEKWKSEAVQEFKDSEAARLGHLIKEFAGKPQFVLDQFAMSHDVDSAKIEYADVLKGELSEQDKTIKELKAENEELATRHSESLPGHVEASERTANDVDLESDDPAVKAQAMWAANTDSCRDEFTCCENLEAELRHPEPAAVR